jgi:hypothetical protein
LRRGKSRNSKQYAAKHRSHPSEVVPAILRVCKDDEAVAHAIGKALGREVFFELEEGLDYSGP